MPIRSREISTLPSRSRFLKAVIFFTTAILLAAFNVINVLTAFLLCVLGFVGIKILKSNLYRHIEWPFNMPIKVTFKYFDSHKSQHA